MKFLIVCSVILALGAAEFDEIRDKHTENHLQSVNKARDGLLQKLTKIEGKAGDFGTYSGNTQVHLGNSYSASGVEDLSSTGSSSYNSRQSSNSNSQYRNADYRGVGTVYNSDDRRAYASEHDDDDVQTIVTPVNSRFASARRQQEESDLSSVSSSAYRKAQMSEFSEGDLQKTVSSNDAGRYHYPTNEGSSRLSSSSQSTQRQSENSRTSTTLDEADEQSRVQPTQRVTAVVRPGQNVRIAYVPGQGVSSTRIDAASSGSETSSHYVQPSSSSQTYRVYYKPVYTYQPSSNSYQATTSNSESDRSSSTAHRINGVQKPEKLTNYDSFHDSSRGSQSRVQTEERDYDTQQRVAPAPVHQPANGGSSRYSSQASQSRQTQNSSSRYANPLPLSASGSVADSDYQASTHQGTAYYSAPSSASQSRSNSESQGQQRHSSSFSPYLPPQSSRTHQSLSSDRDSQFTSFNNRFSQTGSDDLRNMMSETQRLANLQRSQISSGTSNRYDTAADANSRVYKTAADLDAASANFVSSRNHGFDELAAADRNVAAGSNGGYQKIKSWNRQSQWSSGSEWGPDGKPKTYSSLSTGEAEKYNINGEEAGYKAATSTVEKDGKVSTYSMHE